jgi:hypothetical protein
VTRARWLALATIAIAGAFVTGRLTAPAPVPQKMTDTKRAEEKERTDWKKADDKTEATAEKSQTVTVTKVVTRWLRQDGTVSREQTVDRGSESKSAKDSVAVASASEQATVDKSRIEVQTRTAEALARPRWHLQALGGIDLRLNRTWGASASVRVLGPVTVGAWAMSSRVAGVSLGVTW